jgi:hypothetical protein
MAGKLFHTFDEFWEAISDSLKTYNYPSYHPCCKVWVTRAKKACRDSHTHKTSWGAALASQGFAFSDSKQYLHSHMAEHQWGPPIRLNASCSARVTQPVLNETLQNIQTPPEHPPTSRPYYVHQATPNHLKHQSTPVSPHLVPTQPDPKPSANQCPPQIQLETESSILRPA